MKQLSRERNELQGGDLRLPADARTMHDAFGGEPRLERGVPLDGRHQ